MRFFAILWLCAASCFAQEAGDPTNVKQLYGAALETLTDSDSAYAVLLSNSNGRVKERCRKVELTKELRKQASSILSSNFTYGWKIWKPCFPVYGARLIFYKAFDHLFIDFCFDCEILRVTASSTVDHKEDFDSKATELLRLFQTIFPEDRAINSIR